jgi:hypothetical protein
METTVAGEPEDEFGRAPPPLDHLEPAAFDPLDGAPIECRLVSVASRRVGVVVRVKTGKRR